MDTPAPAHPGALPFGEGLVARWPWVGRLAHQASRPGRRGLAVLAVAVALAGVETPLVATIDSLRAGPAIALSFSHAGSVLLALWRPRWAAALSVLASLGLVLASLLGGGGPWPWGVTPLIVQTCVIVLVALVGGWRAGTVTFAASVVVPGLVIAAAAPWRGLAGPISDLLIFASIAGTALVLTAAVQSRAFMAAALEREQRVSAEELARRRLVEEKARVARELHDVIAHSMSLVSVQARSAPYRLAEMPAAAAAEFDEIADRAKDALNQMRGVLAVLRAPDEQAALAPAPTLDQVSALVASARTAGLSVELSWDVPAATQVAPGTVLAVHRILQEALSNVMRHAPDHEASVEVRVSGAQLVTVVENPLPTQPQGAATPHVALTSRIAERAGRRFHPAPGASGPPSVPVSSSPAASEPASPSSAPGGHGLIGMRERASAAGGTVQAGPTGEGSYRVLASVPLAGVLTRLSP